MAGENFGGKKVTDFLISRKSVTEYFNEARLLFSDYFFNVWIIISSNLEAINAELDEEQPVPAQIRTLTLSISSVLLFDCLGYIHRLFHSSRYGIQRFF